MSVGVLRALIGNELKDLGKNRTNLLLVAIAILLPLVTGSLGGAQKPPVWQIMPFWIVYAQVIVAMTLVSLSLAEEREKRTLEAVLVSPATLWDVVVAKLLFATAVTMVVLVVMLGLSRALVGDALGLGIVLILGTVFAAGVGLVIGFYARNQKTAGAISSPVMLLLFLGPMAGNAVPALRPVLEYSPSTNVIQLSIDALQGKPFPTHPRDFWLLLGWAMAFLIWGYFGARRQSA